ncbi:Vacuolar protein sorting-associated protein 29 [Platanthera guangdongensis]|uniref:Vacuolar protein sorting-associated protein 29 n=1 Tax=Platanthera guangdongensis TaxID=2320717 RepID=A0ABR2LL92_9ASPA
MVLVLALGDLHIPHRAADLPAKFKSMLVPGKIHHILCTDGTGIHSSWADRTEPDRNWVEPASDTMLALALGSHLSYDNRPRPLIHLHRRLPSPLSDHPRLAQVVPWGDLDSLAMLQRKLDVDILITGHTHQFKAYKHEGGVVINPGSATGAYSSISYDVNPSFVLMDIDGLHVVLYVYELIDGEVKVDRIDFKKSSPPRPTP